MRLKDTFFLSFLTDIVVLCLMIMHPSIPAARLTRLPFNPLSPKSDQHQISPCKISAL